MSCLKNIPNVHASNTTGNIGNNFPLVQDEDKCNKAPDLYLITEESVRPTDVDPIYTEQALYIAV
jgi:hypothetical protein